MTSKWSLRFLKEASQRSQDNLKANRNLLEQLSGNPEGQFLFAVKAAAQYRNSSVY